MNCSLFCKSVCASPAWTVVLRFRSVGQRMFGSGARWDETRRSSRRRRRRHCRRRRTIKARRSRPSVSPVHQLAVVEHFLALCGLCATAAAVKTGSHSSELHLTRLLHPLLVYTANISTLKRTAGAPTCERMRNPSQLWNQNQTFEPEIWGSVCLL